MIITSSLQQQALHEAHVMAAPASVAFDSLTIWLAMEKVARCVSDHAYRGAPGRI